MEKLSHLFNYELIEKIETNPEATHMELECAQRLSELSHQNEKLISLLNAQGLDMHFVINTIDEIALTLPFLEKQSTDNTVAFLKNIRDHIRKWKDNAEKLNPVPF